MNEMKREKLEGEQVEAGEAGAADAETVIVRNRRPWIRPTLLLIVPLLLLALGGYWWLTSGKSESTDNAQVKTDIVSVSSQVTGPVIEVDVKNGDHVKAGDVLFKIDPAPFQVALEQAEGQLAAAQLQTTQLKTQAAGTSADITGAEATLAVKKNAFARQQTLLKQGFTTRADYDTAYNDLRTAEADLEDAKARAANAQAAIAPGQQPSIQQAQAAVDKAKLDLQSTVVRAPMSGDVANADKLQVGQMAVQGLGMLSVVHSNGAWVEANFKEKQLTRMVPGQKATITIDAYPGTKFPGYVQSVGAGTGSEFSLLPAQNANGNWVKVTQRVPVRIAFEGTPSRPMIAGLSAEVTVTLNSNR